MRSSICSDVCGEMGKMMSKPKVVSQETCCESAEEQIRIAAYLNWEKTTGGQPVDEEATKRFWIEAEKEVVGDLDLVEVTPKDLFEDPDE